MEQRKWKISAREIAIAGLMVAVIEVCKLALLAVPNLEATSFWIIMATLFLGKSVLFIIPVFILVEFVVYGFGLWWVMYLYAWPLLALATWLLRKMDSPLGWGVVSGVFGLLFGLLCSFPYLFLGTDTQSGLAVAFSWWVAGIPYDLIHCVGNFAVMLVLYRPVKTVMQRLYKPTQTKIS